MLSPVLASHLRLARDYVANIYAERRIAAGPNADLDLLIEELMPWLDQSNRQDRTLLRLLKSLKRAIVNCSGALPKDQTSIETSFDRAF